jgi:hypothetical protein
MSANEWVLTATAVISAFVAVAAVIRDRRKPALDTAQAQSALINSDSVKATIKRMSDETNLARDQRIWALEQYVDKMRPWTRSIHDIIDDLCRRLKAELEVNGGQMPDIVVPDAPEVPPPMPSKGT